MLTQTAAKIMTLTKETIEQVHIKVLFTLLRARILSQSSD